MLPKKPSYAQSERAWLQFFHWRHSRPELKDPMPTGCKSWNRPSASYKSAMPSLNRRFRD